MDILSDIILVNKEIISKTRKTISKSPAILLMGVVYSIISFLSGIIVFKLLAGLGMLLGLIYALIQSAIVSSYLFVLHNAIVYNRFRWKDIKHGITYFIRKVYGVMFIFFLANLILGFLLNIIGPLAEVITILTGGITFILLNPLPESLYIKDRDSLQTIVYCVDFMKENWLNWLLPNMLLMIMLSFTTGRVFLGGLNPFTGFSFGASLGTFIMYLLGSIIISLAMIYRGHLFVLLSTTTLRKRMFMRKL